jgi:Mrp family chromosome partitioning ATPase/uncharacterized protein involved in exopolysaccharide biosynthesis
MEPSPLYSVELPKPLEDGGALELPVGGVSFSGGTVSAQTGRVRQVMEVARSSAAMATGGDPAERADYGGASGGNVTGGSDYYDTARRALRGRYGRAIGLGLIAAMLGAGAGWKLGRPEYKSDGVVRIAAYRPPADKSPEQPRPPQVYEQAMKTQQALLTSRRILGPALSDPEWQATGRSSSTKELEAFVLGLTVQRPVNSELLQISYTDQDPVVAAAGVKAVIRSFAAAYHHDVEEFEARRQAVLQQRQRVLQGQLEEINAKIRLIAQEFGTTNLDPLYEAAGQRAAMLQAKAMDVRMAIAVAVAQAAPPRGAAPRPATGTGAGTAKTAGAPQHNPPGPAPAPAPVEPPPLSIGQIEHADALMHEYVAAQTRALDALAAAQVRGLGDNHPEVDRLRWQVERATARVERYAQEYRSTEPVLAKYSVQAGGLTAAGGAAASLPGALSVDVLRADQTVIEEALERTNREMALLNTKRTELAPFRSEAERIRAGLDEKKNRQELLETEQALGQDVEVISSGEVPLKPVRDTRLRYTAAGAFGGACLPAGLLLLFGVLNRRYRYSDEAATDVAATASAPLLGILPALCNRFDDPDHAASAAQCIHQIRAVLQVSRPEARQQGVYLVTSSTPGEGKTSVAVSLALSFAASGARTLLVDCDIVGQSITRGFGADGRPGLRDALARGTVRGFAHRTAVGPYLVGVGTSDVLDAAVVSSIAVRRLLLDARRYFDAIIVDSGPILGSIEATAVAPEVDGVIFAVSRGQQPALAEKAIRHLQAIGATIGGFIFNRAAAKDFSGWTQSSSLRSFGSKAGGGRPPLGDAESLSTFGPLVRAVASLMPAGRALLAAPGQVKSVTHAAAVAKVH